MRHGLGRPGRPAARRHAVAPRQAHSGPGPDHGSSPSVRPDPTPEARARPPLTVLRPQEFGGTGLVPLLLRDLHEVVLVLVLVPVLQGCCLWDTQG